MMFADLIDLDDLAAQLRRLGVDTGAQHGLRQALRDWLAQATDQQLAEFEAMDATLRLSSQIEVLPAVIELLDEAQLGQGQLPEL